jgi:predicted ribosome quality control (RQC) complex YloA/Tae2 family protein
MSVGSEADRLAAALAARLRRARARVQRRVEAVSADLARADEAAAAAARAQWLVAEAARAPRGARVLRGTDLSTGQAVELAVGPAQSPREALDAVFREARRRRAAKDVVLRRLDESVRALAALDACLAELEAMGEPSPASLAELEARARSAAPRDLRHRTAAPATGGRDEPRPPHRTFRGSEGRPILVGRSATHNDALTFHVAKPYHLWLHAKGVTGAHVVVPLRRGESCPAPLLVDAAHLAAHFSDARGEAVCEVSYLPRKWVRKPRGAPPGAVTTEREKVLLLRSEPARLAALLAAELAPSSAPAKDP